MRADSDPLLDAAAAPVAAFSAFKTESGNNPNWAENQRQQKSRRPGVPVPCGKIAGDGRKHPKKDQD